MKPALVSWQRMVPPNMNTTSSSCMFAVIVVAVNWNASKIAQDGEMIVEYSWDGAVIVSLFCLCALILLLRSIYLKTRYCARRSIKVRCPIRVSHFFPCLLLLPMFVQSGLSYVEEDDEGIAYLYTRGYGGDFSESAFYLALATIVAFRFHAELVKIVDQSD